MLETYIRHFTTVEINNSFYRLPEPPSLEAWRDSTPADFVFAMKASRFLTHNKKLKDPENALENFLPRAELLGAKLGPILFQLPPHWKINLERLDQFLSTLPKTHRYAFEFREHTWFHPESYALLRAHNAAFCIYDLAQFETAHEITADFTYVRLHGPEQWKYTGSYSEEQLAEWARRIRRWGARLRAIYVYFDNDEAGYAAQNARTLKHLTEDRTVGRAA